MTQPTMQIFEKMPAPTCCKDKNDDKHFDDDERDGYDRYHLSDDDRDLSVAVNRRCNFVD